MTLILHLPPDTEAKLRERAALEGRREEDIAIAAVEKLLEHPAIVQPRRRIDEFRGIGRRAPIGRDAQDYINEMRDEWDAK